MIYVLHTGGRGGREGKREGVWNWEEGERGREREGMEETKRGREGEE